MSNLSVSPEAQKTDLRAAALMRRNALSDQQRIAASLAIAAHDLPFEIIQDTVIAGYSPVRSEVDPAPLMQRLAAKGARLALPVIIARDQSLTFRAWAQQGKLVSGQLGILEPSPDEPDVVPDIILVPLAAFDRTGHRIGYGAGYYDRTLQGLRQLKKITAIGLAFAVQEIPEVPALEHDAQLDCVLTEAGLVHFRG
jgi:5-formyltetrahydrofolate cyclo-ligase